MLMTPGTKNSQQAQQDLLILAPYTVEKRKALFSVLAVAQASYL